MRINVGRGSGGSLNRYLLDEKKRAKGFELESPIFCTNMVGADVAELNAEFQLSADLRSDVKRTIAHYSISFPPGENPSLETKQAIVEDLLQEMGHQDCQFFAVEHHDQQHKRGVYHLHIASSTINLEGNWVSDKFERVRLKDIERTLELRHGLEYCPARAKGERRNLTTGESRQEERTGEPCAKRQLWEVLDNAIADKPDLPTALLRVRAAGVDVRFTEHEDGKKGLSFGLEGKHFPGKRLGDRYSFYGLQQYAELDYQSDRDDPILQAIEQLTPRQCEQQLQKQQEQCKPAPGAWELLQQPAAEPEPAETKRSMPGSIQRNRAEFVLDFAHATLEKKQKASAENSSYRLDRTEQEITVTRKANGQIIAQGKLGAIGWDITVAEVELTDWRNFLKQQREVNQEQSRNPNRSQQRSTSKQQSRDDELSL